MVFLIFYIVVAVLSTAIFIDIYLCICNQPSNQHIFKTLITFIILGILWPLFMVVAIYALTINKNGKEVYKESKCILKNMKETNE